MSQKQFDVLFPSDYENLGQYRRLMRRVLRANRLQGDPVIFYMENRDKMVEGGHVAPDYFRG